MAEEMLKYYNTLTAEQQREAFDFIIFLWGKNNPDTTFSKSDTIDWESMKAPSERAKNAVEFVRELRNNDRF